MNEILFIYKVFRRRKNLEKKKRTTNDLLRQLVVKTVIKNKLNYLYEFLFIYKVFRRRKKIKPLRSSQTVVISY